MRFFLLLVFLSTNLYPSQQTVRTEQEQMVLDYHLATTTHLGNFEAVKQLLSYGANPNSFFQETEDDGATPLQIALWRGHDSIATLLINHGAKLDESEETTKGSSQEKL